MDIRPMTSAPGRSNPSHGPIRPRPREHGRLMAQLSDDCFALGDEPLRLEDAVRLIGERLACAVGTETVPSVRADGRILAGAIAAPRDLPGFDNSAVDGYAVRHADLESGTQTILEVAGRGPAGSPAGPARARAAYRIFTGAPIPAGLDTVFMQEDVRRDEGGRAVLPPGLARGANVRRAGEDLARGEPALPAGRRLAPADLALMGALGIGSVEVRQPLRVALFSTGDEIASEAGCGAAPPDGRLHDANRPMLAAWLRRLGAAVTDGGILPDRPDAVGAALRDAAAGHDLVMTSGGVSVGEEDHVRDAVASSGSLVFWRIGIKPGRPVAMGIVAGTPFIGLPGSRARPTRRPPAWPSARVSPTRRGRAGANSCGCGSPGGRTASRPPSSIRGRGRGSSPR